MAAFTSPRFLLANAQILAACLLISSCAVRSQEEISGKDSGSAEHACKQQLREDADQLVGAHNLPGLVLIAGYKSRTLITLEFGAFTSRTTLPVASASKLIVAIVALTLEGNGQVSLDAPLSDYLHTPELQLEGLTLKTLLTHQSGIPPNAVFEALGEETELGPTAHKLLSLTRDFSPGEGFSYGGSSYQVAGAAMEAATGQPWNELVATSISKRLGTGEIVFAHPLSNPYTGTPQIGGGAYTSAETIADLLKAVAMSDADTQTTTPFRQAMTADLTPNKNVRIAPEMVRKPFRYGLGLWNDCTASSSTCDLWHSAGAFGTIPQINAKAQTWAVIATKGPLGEMYVEEMKILAHADECVQIISGHTSP